MNARSHWRGGTSLVVTRNDTDYWIELPTCENTLLALEPIRRTVPTTITRMTASITAYSAMSWPSSSLSSRVNSSSITTSKRLTDETTRVRFRNPGTPEEHIAASGLCKGYATQRQLS